ncbi:hypothetical protein C0J52_26395 [Blattella germanica]|nr:hypothetical protein C0J52_26395 [Blattella germanica]
MVPQYEDDAFSQHFRLTRGTAQNIAQQFERRIYFGNRVLPPPRYEIDDGEEDDDRDAREIRNHIERKTNDTGNCKVS